MLVIGFAFLLLIPAIIIFFNQEPAIIDKISLAQIKKAGLEIEKSVYEVYYFGYPSKEEISIYLPNNLINNKLIDNNLIITLDSYSLGLYNYTINFNINVTGSFNLHPGINKLIIKAEEFGVVIETK